MSSLATRAFLGVSLLFLVASCGNNRTADVEESDQQTPSVSASPPTDTPPVSPPAEPTGQTSTPPPRTAVEAKDLRLMDDFVAFAVQPSSDTDARLPFAGKVQLGLSLDLRTALDAADTPHASAWVLNAKYFRAYTGPFSALELIQRHAGQARSRSVLARRGVFHVSVGDHPHCASPPVTAPQGFEGHRRVSVQPSATSIDSCLSWFTVDLFLNEEGSIEAVTLDLWEP
jgi:hypothetical protein